jgi:hypothetical protein
LLVLGEHALADLGCLLGRVAAIEELRRRPAFPVCPEPLRVRAGRSGGDFVGEIEDRLRRAVVALKRDDSGVREVHGKIENVLGARRPKSVDCLCVVADRGQPALLLSQRTHDLHLQRVQVLVLIDQHLLEHSCQLRADDWIAGERVPAEQQVIQIEDGELALPLAEGAKEAGDLFELVLAPRERVAEDLGKRLLGVDAARIDIEQRPLAGKPLLGRGKPLFFAKEIDQVSRVRGVEDPEPGRQPERRGVHADQSMRCRMEGAAGDASLLARSDQRSRAVEHLPGRPSRERQQQNPRRRDPAADQPRDPGTKRRRLARSRPCKHEQRPTLVRGSRTLFLVQPLQHLFETSGSRQEHMFDRLTALFPRRVLLRRADPASFGISTTVTTAAATSALPTRPATSAPPQRRQTA